MSLVTEMHEEIVFLRSKLATLERRRVITTDPEEAEMCCGFGRDGDGVCRHRPSHPVFVSLVQAGEESKG